MSGGAGRRATNESHDRNMTLRSWSKAKGSEPPLGYTIVIRRLYHSELEAINQSNKTINQSNKAINQSNKAINQSNKAINQSNKAIIQSN